MNKKKMKKAKKAKSNQAKHEVVATAAAAASSKSSVRHDDYSIDIDTEDKMTATERAAFQKKQERELEELKSIATLSHRERVEAYNEKLSQLTEHNDIPRVSAAGNV
jgi:protein FAM32A